MAIVNPELQDRKESRDVSTREGSLRAEEKTALDLGSTCVVQQKSRSLTHPTRTYTDIAVSPFRDLSLLDKLLAPLIVIAMIIGVVIGSSLVVCTFVAESNFVQENSPTEYMKH